MSTPFSCSRRSFSAGLAAAPVAFAFGCGRDAAPSNVFASTASPGGTDAAPGGRAPRYSDRVADVPLINHRGEQLRFRSDRLIDAIAVIAFMYVQCDGICPATTALLRDLRPELSRLLGPQVRFLSITLDPERDDPESLARYAAAHGGGPRVEGLADWEFLTGEPADVDALRVSLGYRDPDPRIDADRGNHAALITFGNDRIDRWSALPVGISFGQTVAAILKCCSRDRELQWNYATLAATPRAADSGSEQGR